MKPLSKAKKAARRRRRQLIGGAALGALATGVGAARLPTYSGGRAALHGLIGGTWGAGVGASMTAMFQHATRSRAKKR